MEQAKPGAVYAAIAAVIADVGTVGKHAKNKEQGFSYRSADAICDELHDALGKHKVFTTCTIHSREVKERQSRSGGILTCISLKCTYTFWGDDGSNVSTDSWGESMDSGDKATNKAMTAAYKYALLQTFCMMGHGDPDADSPQPITMQPQQEKPAKPQATVLSQAEINYIGDATETINGVTSEESLLAVCEVIRTKSEAIRNALRPLAEAKLKVLRTSHATREPEAATA